MTELNLNQIIEKLNGEFTGDTRKLVLRNIYCGCHKSPCIMNKLE